MVLIIFALLMAVLIFPFKFPVKDVSQSDGFFYCREFVSEAESVTISGIPSSPGGTDSVQYKSIKINVPIKASGIEGKGHHMEEGNETEVNGKKYKILYPKPEGGRSYDFNTEDGLIKGNGIIFVDYGIIFLQQLNNDGTPVTVPGGKEILYVIDIYQDVSKPPIPQAENILKCVDEGTETLSDPVVIMPEQQVSQSQEQVQMEWFTIRQTKTLPHAWWTPECKPAIYLYPPQKQLVNVKVFPQGYLTYVDPPYDMENGWTFWANPNGQLQTSNEQRVTNYDYLYYESKIRDDAIRKPEKGWVVKSELGSMNQEAWFRPLKIHFEEILPKLGLNEKETQDFVEYWQKSLPQAPYYFVGIVDPGNIDEIERLEITPRPDSINRVRVYFERLDSQKTVEAPVLKTINDKQSLRPEGLERLTINEFRVTEWGGMVKNDPNHPFTCSQ